MLKQTFTKLIKWLFSTLQRPGELWEDWWALPALLLAPFLFLSGWISTPSCESRELEKWGDKLISSSCFHEQSEGSGEWHQCSAEHLPPLLASHVSFPPAELVNRRAPSPSRGAQALPGLALHLTGLMLLLFLMHTLWYVYLSRFSVRKQISYLQSS